MGRLPDQRTYRTPETRERFLALLAETGYVDQASKAAGFPRRQTVYEWREADPDFAQAWDDALEAYTQALEAEADRRGMRGVPEPVYWRGEQVGTVQKYSDVLLMFRLNGMRPEKYRQRHEHTGKDGQPINVSVKVTLAEAFQRAYHTPTIQGPVIDVESNGSSAD
jgi:hypothetical protein